MKLAAVLHWMIVALSTMNAGYMTYDGARALVTGDYIRPRSGDYAGQLGPWTKLVEKIGIDPMSTLMKCVFLVFGLAGLVITAAFAVNAAWGWNALLVFNVCCMWNLFLGTASSVLQVILLIASRVLK